MAVAAGSVAVRQPEEASPPLALAAPAGGRWRLGQALEAGRPLTQLEDLNDLGWAMAHTPSQ